MANIRNFQTHTPTVHETAFVDDTAVLIGAVTVARDASIWPMSVARGDIGTICIGERTNIQDGVILHTTVASRFSPAYHLNIGDEVTVGHAAVLHACEVGNLCLVGMNATVLDGAVLEPYTMVAANALVPPGKHLTGKFLWAGVPVQKMRPLKDEELEFLVYSAVHYVELKNQYL